MIKRVKIAIVILNGLKIVSVTGIIPILLIMNGQPRRQITLLTKNTPYAKLHIQNTLMQLVKDNEF